MKRSMHDVKLGLGILVALVSIVVLVTMQQEARPVYPKLSSLSSDPQGALALKLWMDELNYMVEDQVSASFNPPPAATILLALEPLAVTTSELATLDEWVEDGGNLIAIGEQYGMYVLARHYGFSLELLPGSDTTINLETPFWNSPAPLEMPKLQPQFALIPERDDHVVLISYLEKPTLVFFELGQGRIILGTIPDIFTNAGLKEAGNPELVLNILTLAGPRGTIWFDEWHHGLRGLTHLQGPEQFLRRTALGRASLFGLFAIFLVVFLQGRSFGRPVPLPQETTRRGAWDHITGIANLGRRAAHRPAVMRYYHEQLKRKLGQRYRLDPSLDDERYVALLAGYNSALDQAELLKLLRRLKQPAISEAEMVQVAADAARWINAVETAKVR